MFFYLLTALIVVPAIEVVLILKVSVIGWGNTFAVIVLTGIAGSWLARRQGARAWRGIQESLAAGRVPTTEALDALLIFAAGLVLLTPGFVTDALGFLLLIPVTRGLFRTWLVRHFKNRTNVKMQFGPQFGAPPFGGAQYPQQPMDDGVIDVESRPVEDDQLNSG